MKWLLLPAVLSLAALSSTLGTPAHAAAPVPVAFGTTWDGPGNGLQAIVDAIVFTGSEGDGATTLVTFPAGTTRLGFHLDPKTAVASVSGPMRQLSFTNRVTNDIGPLGFAATHAHFDGDVQALVFDVSAWKGPDTWLVCFEDLDSGLPVQGACSGTDDDSNDVVFQVAASGATPVQSLAFGAVKVKYR